MAGRNIALIATVLLTLRAGFKSKKARNKLFELIENKRWLINFGVIILFIGYIVYITRNDKSEDSSRLRSVKEGSSCVYNSLICGSRFNYSSILVSIYCGILYGRVDIKKSLLNIYGKLLL